MTAKSFDRKLLVLDLDETLIYATTTPLDRPADFHAGAYHVYQRPHLTAFLDTCFARFTVAVWTTASPAFATRIVEQCFPPAAPLAFVWASNRCRRVYNADTTEWEWRKPLDKLTRRGWHRQSILAIDDTPAKWAASYGNLIPIPPWYGAPHDDTLPRLATYLNHLYLAPNVRTVEKRGWHHATSGLSTRNGVAAAPDEYDIRQETANEPTDERPGSAGRVA